MGQRKLFRFKLGEVAASGVPLEMSGRIPVWAGLIAAAMFAVFASVWVAQFNRLDLHALGSVPDLMGTLFSLFWLMGWTLGVLFLGAVTAFLLFFRQMAFIDGKRLVNVAKVGPFNLVVEYELSRIQNPRIEEDAGGKTVKIVFEYGGLANSLGNMMQRDGAERNLKRLQAALSGAPAGDDFVMQSASFESARPAPTQWTPPGEIADRGLPLASMVSLVAANLIPLFMVLWGDWTLEQVILLFWAESAVIALYTLLKMAVVARWWAIFPGVFFLGHFGGFMALHFLFIYELFLRGSPAGIAPEALPELVRVFAPLQLALLALVASHATSFVLNFMMRREYEGERVQNLVKAPYSRIVVMQLTLIFGGWVVMLLHSPAPALAMLIVFKIFADLRGHYGERHGAPQQ